MLDKVDIAPDYTVILPRMALDGREVRVPPIALHKTTEEVCYMRELM